MDRWVDPFSVSYCMLCGRSDPSEDKYLLNGAVYHDQCVKRVDELIGRFEQQRADLSRKVNQGWLERFLATLTGPVPSRDVLRNELRNAEKTIKYLSHLRDAYYDFWPTYPPDWHHRRERVLVRSGHRCEQCGSRNAVLHVHHRVPRQRGGTHRLQNLVALCNRCHQRRHLHPIGNTETWDSPPPGEHMQKVELISRALREGWLVHFHYRRRDGQRSQRSVRPLAIVTIEAAPCLKGYCYLRHAERHFHIGRMSRVELLKQPGPCLDLP